MNRERGLSNKQNNRHCFLKITLQFAWQTADEFWVVCQRMNLHGFDGSLQHARRWISFSHIAVLKSHINLWLTHKHTHSARSLQQASLKTTDSSYFACFCARSVGACLPNLVFIIILSKLYNFFWLFCWCNQSSVK